MFFFGCFGSRFTATLLEIRRWLFHKKDKKCKKSVHLFQHFSIFVAVWHSWNLERMYIFSTKAVLQPPCWRYRGGRVFLFCHILSYFFSPFFLGCFRSRFTATLLEIRRWLFHKKDRKCKKSVHLFQRFSIFEAVWRSRNLKRMYIFSTKAVLRPPCRR